MFSTVLSSDRLPPEWSGRGVAEMLAWLSVTTVAAAGFAVAAARVWADGLVLRGELFALFAAVIAGLAVSLAITFRHRGRGLASGVRLVAGADQATVFVPSAALRWTFPLTCAGASGAFGWWGVLRLVNKVPWTDPATAMRSPVAGVALLAIAVSFAVACRALVRRGFTSRDGLVPGIQLSADGLRYRGGVEVVLPWESISGITADWETGRRGGSAPTVLITYAPDVPGVERGRIAAPDGTLPLRPDNYAVGAPRLLHALRFYLDRPELRAELGTEASVTRIRAGFAPQP